MKRKLLVTINAGEKTCDGCESHAAEDGHCGIFWTTESCYGHSARPHNTELEPDGEKDLRCEACLSAERAAKVVK
jgi:hypothetical protein